MSSAPLVAPPSSVQLGANMAAAMNTFNRIMVPTTTTSMMYQQIETESRSTSGLSFFPFRYFFQYATRRAGRRKGDNDISTLARLWEPVDRSVPMVSSAVEKFAESECPFRYTLRMAHESDIVPVCHWRSEEFGYRAHWDYMVAIYKCDPRGWFVATDDTGEIIGNIFGMNLNDQVAFGGLFAVKKPFRCHGVGGKLWDKRLEHVGDRNLGVNAVESRILPNTKLGMTLSFRMARYFGKIPEPDQQILLELEPSIEGDLPIDLHTFDHVDQNTDPRQFAQLRSLMDQLIDYDSSVNTIPRPSFLNATLLDQSAQMITVVATRQRSESSSADILGYGMVRPRYKGVTIGPLYAESGDIARAICRQLLTRLIKSTKLDHRLDQDGGNIMDVTIIDDVNNGTFQHGCPGAIMMEFVKRLGLKRECFLYRMYSKGDIILPLDKVYGVTSSEAFLL